LARIASFGAEPLFPIADSFVADGFVEDGTVEVSCGFMRVGLRLDTSKGPVEVIAVDHAEEQS
jgi:hypothetical protein